MSDVAQVANNQAAGFGYTEPRQVDTGSGIEQVPVAPSRFAVSQQEQNRQILKAEDLQLASPEQRAATLSKISTRLSENHRKDFNDELDTRGRHLEERIDNIRSKLSEVDPDYLFGWDTDNGTPTSPLEEVFRVAPASDRDVGGFLSFNPAEVGAGDIKQQQLVQQILPAVLALAGPHAMHSLQLEGKANEEGASQGASAKNVYHHGVDSDQLTHLVQSNIKEYFRNAKLGNVSDETAARLSQIALRYYEDKGEIVKVANPDPIDRVKRPYLYESAAASSGQKKSIEQLMDVGEGLFGKVREGFYTAPALNLIGRLGEYTKTSLGALLKKYREIMNMKINRGELGQSGHELTKVIKGSIAEGTTSVNLMVNDTMYRTVMAQGQFSDVQNEDARVGQEPTYFKWSTNPAAKIFGLSQADYESYRAEYSPPKDNAGKFTQTAAQNEQRATLHALKQMTERLYEYRKTVLEMQGETATLLASAAEKRQPLYSRFINSLMNNRFYRTNLVYNPESNKFDRNISNFVEQHLLHNKLFSYDTGTLASLQGRVKSYETNLGNGVTESLHRDFTPQEQTAIGMMAILAKLYLDINPPPGSTGAAKNLTPWQLVGEYNKGVHNWAIQQGALIDSFISGIDVQTGAALTPEAQAQLEKDVGELFKTKKGPWTMIESGELGGTLNPFIDAYRLSKATPQSPHRITTVVSMDVTQSGPALAGLMTAILNTEGGIKTLKALYEPGWVNSDGSVTGEKDLRGQMAASTPKIIREIIQNEDQADAMNKIVKAMFDEGVLEKFYKFPIMTTIYTRDSGSFADDIDRFFIEEGLTDVVNKVAETYKGGRAQVRKDWAMVMKNRFR